MWHSPHTLGFIGPWVRRPRGPSLLNDQSTLEDTTISVSCPSGSVSISWGDGSSSSVTCDGTLRNYVHTYTATGQYVIRMAGTLGAVTDFRCESQSWISGELADILVGFADLAVLRLHTTSVSGDISAVSCLTNLTVLYLYNTSVLGDLSAVSYLTDLVRLYAYNTSISGDISAVSPLTSARYLLLYNTSISSYSSVTLPAWANADIRINNLGLSTTEIDNFLIDLEDGVGANGDLTFIAGNDARSAASDAAYAALLAAGWGGDIT